MYSVNITDYAFGQLSGIKQYLSRDSIDMATRITDEIVDFSLERLADFPFSGPKVFDNYSYRNIFKHSYRIVYEVLEKEVNILTIIHTHQDIERIIEQLGLMQK